MISGTPIRLWCLVRGSSSAFYVTIGRDNFIIDLKKLIKAEIPNDIKAIQLTPWRVNIDQSQIKTISIDDMLRDENILEISGLKVGEAFQNTEENSIRVIVEVPVADES